MKKRAIITLIFTIFCIIATNKLWLVFKPMPISFNVDGVGKYKFTVELNEKDDSNFRKVKSASETIDLLGYEDVVNIDVYRLKSPKRLKLVIVSDTQAGGGNTLTISGFRVRKENISFKSQTDFFVKNADINIKNNKLFVTPLSKEKVEIIYKSCLTSRCAVKFDFGIFFSILILSFLLFFKLTSYLADFKNIKNKSRIEIVFLTIFFVFLFVPMSHINQNEISKVENRKLASKPLFITETGEINYSYGKQFDSWFNDRFNLRKNFISLYNFLVYKFSMEQATIGKYEINKKYKFFFFNLSKCYNQNFDMNYIEQNLYKLNDYCRKNDIKLYVLIVPQREFIYDEWNSKTKKILTDSNSELVNKTKQKFGVEIIYPKLELEQLKKQELVFYRTDHHPTDEAQYLLYNLLIDKMKKDLPMLKITQRKDFDIYKRNLVRAEFERNFRAGYTYERANISDKSFSKFKYTYFDYKNLKDLKIQGEFPHFSMKNKNGNYKLLIIGDSYQESLAYFLITSFNEIEKYRINSGKKVKGYFDTPKRKKEFEFKPYSRIIEKYKPDAMLIIINTERTNVFEDLFDKEY